MSFKHPAHYNYQGYIIFQSDVVCDAATFIGLLASILRFNFFLILFSSRVLCIIIRFVLCLHMTLLFLYFCLILLYICLELYVFSVFTICNSPVDCRMVQFHTDCSVTPASYSSEYCFLLSDVQVQSNKAETLWTWHVDELLSVWEEWGNVAKFHCWAQMLHHNFPANLNPKTVSLQCLPVLNVWKCKL